MQLLDFALPVDFGIPADPRIKGAGRLLLQLLLPGVNLVRVDFVPLRQVRNRRLFPQRLQRNLRLQPRVDLPSRLFHHSLRLAYDGTARSQLPGRSQIQGPLQSPKSTQAQNYDSTVQNSDYSVLKPTPCAEAVLSGLWIAALSRSNPLLLAPGTQMHRQITVYNR